MTGAETVAETTVHASCVVIREAGVLVRGPSGAGKSTLAARLVWEAERLGWFGRLVADDRVRLAARGGRVVARPVPAVAGLVEARGLGLRRLPHAPGAVLRLVVDLVPTPPDRFPEEGATVTDVLGLRLPRITATAPDAFHLAMWRLRGKDDTLMTEF